MPDKNIVQYSQYICYRILDFQLMVEGLEGRLSAKQQEPAQSKTQPAQTKPQPTLTTTAENLTDMESGLFEEFQQYRTFLALRNNRVPVIQLQPPADNKSGNRNNRNGGEFAASDDDNDDEHFI